MPANTHRAYRKCDDDYGDRIVASGTEEFCLRAAKHWTDEGYESYVSPIPPEDLT